MDVSERIRVLAARDRLAQTLGIELVRGDAAQVVLRLRLTEAHANFYGYGHGGAIFTLADAAFGLLCNAQAHVAVALDVHLTFSTAVRPGEELIATAQQLTRTRHTGTYRVDVHTAAGARVSQFTGTAYVTDKPVPDTTPDGP